MVITPENFMMKTNIVEQGSSDNNTPQPIDLKMDIPLMGPQVRN